MNRKDKRAIVSHLKRATDRIHKAVLKSEEVSAAEPTDYVSFWLNKFCPLGQWTEEQRDAVLDVYYRRFGGEEE